ncbi:conserved repeat domain protein [Candidatus Vecturithrix granuli]|uniref:Conserved repeat domain protein n=1 Tax=Vecturithrix granuli TaxID=1499967 RepID=A0A081C3F7_VECG1|nr:conserved repeat domain protein [Candidatus Vecturithrix granuli]
METQEYDISTLLVVPLSRIIVGILLFIALLNGEQTLALLTFLILCLVRGVKLWSQASLKGLTWNTHVDKQHLFPGEQFTLTIHAENTTWLPVWLRIGIAADGPFQSVEDAASLTRESGLLWYQQVDMQWAFAAQRRGVYRIGLTSLRAGDLLGFFPHDRPAKDPRQILVYPRLIPLTGFSVPKREVWGTPGAKHPIHDPVYLLGTREYHHSQPAKYIHWKASARYNRLQEKLFEPTSQEKMLLVLDVAQFVQHQAAGVFEEMLEVAASAGVLLLQQGQSVGLVTNGRVIDGSPGMLPIASGPRQAQALLELLAKLLMEVTEDLSALLMRDMNWPGGVSCLHLAYCYDETTVTISNLFQRRHFPAMFVVGQISAESAALSEKVRGKRYRLEDVCLQTQQ